MADSNLIWVLADDRAGNRAQVLGVADVLGLPYDVKGISYGPWARLPNVVLGCSTMGLDAKSRIGLSAPWPSLVIAAGRRTAPVALAIKRKSAGQARLVQIMNPGMATDLFDLIVVPSHDPPIAGDNVISVTGAPHGLTDSVLASARDQWMPTLAELPAPRIAVMVGGSTRRREFTHAMARELGVRASEMALAAGGSLMITTSRRTGAASSALVDVLNCPSRLYQWGDEGDNPYLGFLACADAVVVSGDSVSMCSEACAVRVPVQIFAPPELITIKHARCHATLYDGCYAGPFTGVLVQGRHAPLNAAETIARAIKERLLS